MTTMDDDGREHVIGWVNLRRFGTQPDTIGWFLEVYVLLIEIDSEGEKASLGK